MRRRFAILLALSAALLVFPACNRDGFNKGDLEIRDVCLRVKGNMVYSYVAWASQLSFNRGRKEFRAGSDTMSDYFLLTMSEVPHENGQTLTGSLQWTTDDDTPRLTGLSFKVERIGDDGTVWLWCPAQKILVVMKLLN